MSSSGVFRLRRPFWSVRTRILASILAAAAVGLTAVGAITFVVQRDRILAGIDERLLSRVESARLIATGQNPVQDTDGTASPPAEPLRYATTREALEAVIAQVVPDRNESTLGILDGTASFVPGVATSFRLDGDPDFVERVVSDVADGTVRLGTAETPAGPLRYIATPIAVESDVEKGIYVTAVDLEAELEEIVSTFQTYALAAAAALVAIGIVGWMVAGYFFRPIRRLRDAASRITANQRHERVSVVGRDDFSLASETVNGMLDRLDGALTSQRQLLDDVRHELKTPITILRGHLELLDPASPDEVDSTRLLALDELDRMAGLVDDIEALADAQTIVPDRRPVEVAELTRGVFAKASGIPEHKWLLAEAADTSIELDPRLITQAWLQLVDNAAKYSPPWAAVTLGSSELGDSVEFWVSDEGMGIPAGAEERIFERFGRVDTGRGIRGSGLGLPIVMAIATGHGGTVNLVTSPEGSRFGIVVPRVPAPADGEDDQPGAVTDSGKR